MHSETLNEIDLKLSITLHSKNVKIQTKKEQD